MRRVRTLLFCAIAAGQLWASSSASPADLSGFVIRSGGHLQVDGKPFRFTGANIYWLGLDENVDGVHYPTHFRVDDALETAVNTGATVVRAHTLGISVGSPLTLEPDQGVFNPEAFAHVDYAIEAARKAGIRLIMPLTDNYHYYHGGKHTFTDWAGDPNEDDFYTNLNVIGSFEHYVWVLLNHVNIYNHIALKNDPTVLCWETGNEIRPPASWTSTIAAYIKSIDPRHLVMDGTYGINPAALKIAAVDIVSDHFYPLNATRLVSDGAMAAKAGKAFVAGEYGWHENSAELPMFLSAAKQTQVVSGDLYWSLFPHADNYGYVEHDDGLTIHYPGDNPGMASAFSKIRSHAFAMQDVSPPPSLTPLTPKITGVTPEGGIAWRGAANSATYQVEASTSSANGPWTVLTTGRVTDNDTPWLDTTHRSGSVVWYRVKGENLDGLFGEYSPVYTVKLALAHDKP